MTDSCTQGINTVLHPLSDLERAQPEAPRPAFATPASAIAPGT